MSEEKQETMDDIVREMRNLGKLDEKSTDKVPRRLMALGLLTYADRIEAAAKREKNAPEPRSPSASQVSPMPVNDAHIIPQIVNAAQMRNALERIVSLTNSLDENCAVDPVEIRDIARDALVKGE